MRIEACEKNNYNIFINSESVEKSLFMSKEDLIDFIKDLLLKVKWKLNLAGFYKVKVYPNEKVGIFLELFKLDDVEFSSVVDLRVIVLSNEDFYFETEDYDLIKNCNDKRYLDGLFYCLVDDSFDDIIEKVEFGRFIYGREVIKVLNNSLIL